MKFPMIVRFELSRAARRDGHYVARAVVAVALAYASWLVIEAYGSPLSSAASGRAGVLEPRKVSAFAELMVLALLFAHGLMTLLLVPALAAGSIAEEDRRGTMTELLATPWSSGAVVLGKFLSVLIRNGAVLAVGLPLLLPLVLLGLVEAGVVARAIATIVSLAMVIASLSLMVAALAARPRWAVAFVYALIIAWLIVPFRFAPISRRLAGPLAWPRTVDDWALLGHPGESVLLLWQSSVAKLRGDVGNFAWAQTALSGRVPGLAGAAIVLSALFLFLGSLSLRPRRLGLRRWSFGRIRWHIAVRVPFRPPIGEDPLFWKEWHAARHARRPMAWLASGLIALLLIGSLWEPARNAFRECWARETNVGARWTLNVRLRQRSAEVLLVGLVAAAAAGATSIAGERERETWTSLATTCVTGREIARAKVAGSVRGASWVAAPFLGPIVVGLLTGSVHPLGAAAALAGALVFTWYAAAVGVLCSTLSTTSTRALGAVLFVLLVGNSLTFGLVPIDLLGPLGSSPRALPAAFLAPYVEWLSLVSPMEVESARAGWFPDASVRLPLLSFRVVLAPGLIKIYALSLAFHAAVALTATGASAWIIDAGRRARHRGSVNLRGSS